METKDKIKIASELTTTDLLDILLKKCEPRSMLYTTPSLQIAGYDVRNFPIYDLLGGTMSFLIHEHDYINFRKNIRPVEDD